MPRGDKTRVVAIRLTASQVRMCGDVSHTEYIRSFFNQAGVLVVLGLSVEEVVYFRDIVEKKGQTLGEWVTDGLRGIYAKEHREVVWDKEKREWINGDRTT